MKKGRLLVLALLAPALLLSACDLNFDINGGSQNQTQTVVLKSIAVNTLPTKTHYAVNEDIDLTGLVLAVTYEDNSTKNISYSASSNAISLVKKSNNEKYTAHEGNTNVTVQYTEGGSALFASFAITVGESTQPSEATLVSISVETPPTKLTYTIGEDISLAGLVIRANYSDNTSKTITYSATSGISLVAKANNEKYTAVAGSTNVNISYTEKGVTLSASFAITVNSGVTPVTTCTITFDKNGGTGSMDTVTVNSGSSYTLPACGFTAPQYKQFKNWSINGFTYNVGATFIVTSNITVRAIWENLKCTVTFDSNGGTGTMAVQTVNAGSSYTLPSCTFTAPTGKDFKSWLIGSTEYNAGVSVTVTSDITVKATWETAPDKAEWTLMVYMCGSNLESGQDKYGNFHADDPQKGGLATMDIEEILSATGQPNSVNIIIQTGGAGAWASKYGISATKLGRYYVRNGQLLPDSTNSSLSQGNMGDGSTLTSFLEWGMTKYPAKKYGVFMWNHGGGMNGCCYDENYDDQQLWVDEMDAAFTAARTNQSYSNKFEFVAYDACLMAIQDIAELNSHNFNYMLASQESESGYGYVYGEWLPDLYNNPKTITTPYLLQRIGETFMDEEEELYDFWNEPFDQTQSAYDLSKMAAYKTAFEDVASGLSSSVNSSSKWTTFVNNNINHSSVQKYGVDDDGEYNFDIFNATDVLDRIATNYSSLSSKVATAKSALSDVVIYEEHGSATKGCGMNIYCPQHAYYYSTDTNFTNWYNLCSYSGLTRA